MNYSNKIIWGALLLIALLGLFPLLEHLAKIPKKITLYSTINTSNANYISNRNESVIISDPVRIFIPKIEVESSIEYRGVKANGTMDLPEKPDLVAWFKLGVRPGEVGSAVMAGHYGWSTKDAVFDDLHKLNVGDKVYVEDANGAIISFVVREVKMYDPKADATEVFSSQDGKSHLNLITCDGFWNKLTQSYAKRRVVFTDRE